MEKDIIIRMKAGLGNQFFQYAFGKMIKEKYGSNVFYDFSYFENAGQYNIDMITDYNVDLETIHPQRLKEACLFKHNQKPHSFSYRFLIGLEALLNRNYFFESRFKNDNSYDVGELVTNYCYLDGYWQNWAYYTDIKEILKPEFTLKNPLSDEVKFLINKVKSCNSVFIGYRRGDKKETSDVKKLFYGMTPKYYNHSIKLCDSTLDSPQYYAFTNDKKAVRRYMKPDNRIIFLSDSFNLTANEEFAIMSNCKHAIIPNSSFHWWAAWLLENDNSIVIRPEKWRRDDKKWDECPPSWRIVNNT